MAAILSLDNGMLTSFIVPSGIMNVNAGRFPACGMHISVQLPGIFSLLNLLKKSQILAKFPVRLGTKNTKKTE